MVVAALLGLALALPTGALFGIGYGTGVRIGYEQVYPLLFPAGKRGDASTVAETMKGMNQIYNSVGGKEASQMGIAQGIVSAKELNNNPDFQVFEELESKLSGRTSLNLQHKTDLEVTMSSLAASVSSIAAYMSGQTELRPPTVADIPIIIDPSIKPPTQNVPNLSDEFGFGSQTLTQLLPQQNKYLSYRKKHNNLFDWIKIKREEALESAATGGERKPFTPDKPFSDISQPLQNYLTERGRLWGLVQAKHLQIFEITRNNRQFSTSGKRDLEAKTNQLATLQKQLQNTITNARNNPVTKAKANSDWNKRIWKQGVTPS